MHVRGLGRSARACMSQIAHATWHEPATRHEVGMLPSTVGTRTPNAVYDSRSRRLNARKGAGPHRCLFCLPSSAGTPCRPAGRHRRNGCLCSACASTGQTAGGYRKRDTTTHMSKARISDTFREIRHISRFFLKIQHIPTLVQRLRHTSESPAHSSRVNSLALS
jgi:hypothetical protein